MRVAVEIVNGCVESVYADQACEVVVIDRDELGDETLPDGQRGYASIWEASVDARIVRHSFRLADLHHRRGLAGTLLKAIHRVRQGGDP